MRRVRNVRGDLGFGGSRRPSLARAQAGTDCGTVAIAGGQRVSLCSFVAETQDDGRTLLRCTRCGSVMRPEVAPCAP
jgi:hypothetical protein